jgi:hypothetical protein
LQDHVSLLFEAILVAGLYALLSFLFVFTPSDRELLKRAIRRISLSLAPQAVVTPQD